MDDHPAPQIPEPRSAQDDVRLIVVGADGRAASARALAWALSHALGSGARVRVVTGWPVHAPVFLSEVPGHFNEARWAGSRALDETIARAQELVGVAVPVTRVLVNAPPLAALVSASGEASLLVLGTDRPDGDLPRPGQLSPTTPLTLRVRAAAGCPVVLVPPPAVVPPRSRERAETTEVRGRRTRL